MSALAAKLADLPASESVRRGPVSACAGIYPADMDDWREVESMRNVKKYTWRQVQDKIDEMLDVRRPIANDKFRYHYRRRCYCWPEGQRL